MKENESWKRGSEYPRQCHSEGKEVTLEVDTTAIVNDIRRKLNILEASIRTAMKDVEQQLDDFNRQYHTELVLKVELCSE